MNFEEWAAKPLLAGFGIAVPPGETAGSPSAARAACRGPCVVKAQVPAGARGKAGGIKFASGPEETFQAAEQILGMRIAGHRVKKVLVEQQVSVERELYAAVLNDRASRCPTVLFSPAGGIDIEDAAAAEQSALRSCQVDIRDGLTPDQASALVENSDLKISPAAVAETLVSLYSAYRALDAELLEINPLAVTSDSRVIALDCKFVLDDSALKRQPHHAGAGSRESLTELENEAAEAGLRLIQLDGNVGVLANGAGLTMTTMDAVVHFGGKPANFLEIGGDAYTKAEAALRIVLKHPGVKSLLVNFCGAFARTDVMAGGVVEAWKKLQPEIPAFFSVHGTGETEAVSMIRGELGFEPFDLMDDAVRAAVAAANGSGE